MEIKDIFKALGLMVEIEEPWYLSKVELQKATKVVDLHIDFKRGSTFKCPSCESINKVHDSSIRRIRYVDWFDYRCYLNIRIPRVSCADHGVLTLDNLPWMRSNSQYSYKLESKIMSLAKEMSMKAVSAEIGEPDNNLWRVFHHYIKRGIEEQMDLADTRRIAVDETASKRGHDYVTVFTDMDTCDVILVVEGRKAEVFSNLFGWLFDKGGHPKNISTFSMDMSKSYKAGQRNYFPNSEVIFDRFHIKNALNIAVDKVRKHETKQAEELKGTKYMWLKNEKTLTEKEKTKLNEFLIESSLDTAIAYQQRVAFDQLWKVQPKAVEPMLNAWMNNAQKTLLQPLINFVNTINNNYKGIVNSMVTGLTNAISEGINSVIQLARTRARGFRNVENFKAMIYFLGNDFNFQKFYP